jgi:hypothetical protein
LVLASGDTRVEAGRKGSRVAALRPRAGGFLEAGALARRGLFGLTMLSTPLFQSAAALEFSCAIKFGSGIGQTARSERFFSSRPTCDFVFIVTVHGMLNKNEVQLLIAPRSRIKVLLMHFGLPLPQIPPHAEKKAQ